MPPLTLLSLPVEILREIAECLDLQDQTRLAMANGYLHSVVRAPTHDDFLLAEASAWAISKQLFTCKGCVRFRGLSQFADDMRKGVRARSGPDARLRFCLECGVSRDWYSEGEEIAVKGQPAVLRRLCSTLTDRGKSPCGSRLLFWVPLQSRRVSQYACDHSPEQEDDWVWLTRHSAENRHMQETYGLWLNI